MKMKMTTEMAINAGQVLSNLKFDKMEKEEKHIVIRTAAKLKKVAESYDAILDEAQKRLRFDGIEEVAAKQERKEELTEAEKESVIKYNTEIQECMKSELAKEVEIDEEKLSEDALVRIAESNPELKIGALVMLGEALC